MSRREEGARVDEGDRGGAVESALHHTGPEFAPAATPPHIVHPQVVPSVAGEQDQEAEERTTHPPRAL